MWALYGYIGPVWAVCRSLSVHMDCARPICGLRGASEFWFVCARWILSGLPTTGDVRRPEEHFRYKCSRNQRMSINGSIMAHHDTNFHYLKTQGPRGRSHDPVPKIHQLTELRDPYS